MPGAWNLAPLQSNPVKLNQTKSNQINHFFCSMTTKHFCLLPSAFCLCSGALGVILRLTRLDMSHFLVILQIPVFPPEGS